jgi:hypothetical protein
MVKLASQNERPIVLLKISKLYKIVLLQVEVAILCIFLFWIALQLQLLVN